MAAGALKDKSLRQLRTQRFPNAYFLDDGALFQVKSVNWRNQTEIPVHGFRRIQDRIRDEMQELVGLHNQRLQIDYTNRQMSMQAKWQKKAGQIGGGRAPALFIPQDDYPFPPGGNFRLYKYANVDADSGYDLFLCRQRGCERLFTLDQAKSHKFKCPHDETTLSQLAHVWVHLACGTVLRIESEKCYTPGCGQPMRLHLQLDNLIHSYWWCAHCQHKHWEDQHAMDEYSSRRGDGTWQPGYRRSLFKTCPTCEAGAKIQGVLEVLRQEDDTIARSPDASGEHLGGMVRMGLTTARSVYKPMSLTVVNIENEDPTALVYEWFGGEISDDELRNELNEFTRPIWDTSEEFRRKYREQRRQIKIAQAPPVPNLHPKADSMLRDYEGTRRSEPQDLAKIRPEHAERLSREFGVRASFLKQGISLVDVTYGYLVGSSDPQIATANVFTSRGEDIPLLGEKLDTEAILIELDPERALDWLTRNSVSFSPVVATDSPPQCMRRHLLTCDSRDPVLTQVATLIHTMSHALIRSSERYTGISRDSLYELVWPRGLAFLLYSGERINLGMLESCFDGNLHRWFHGARSDASHCPHDPICAADIRAACHACLYLNERNCTEFWNKWLDRRTLLGFDVSRPGYWGSPR